MAQIKVTRRGHIRFDPAAAAKAAGDAIIKHVAKRVTEGRDVADAPLPAYSALYRQQLAVIGDSSSQGAALAELVRALRVIQTTTTNGRTAIAFGVGNTQVTSTPRPPPWVFDRAKTPAQRAAAVERWRTAPKRSESNPIALVLKWLASSGNGHRPIRIVGVSPRGRADVIKALERARVFRS